MLRTVDVRRMGPWKVVEEVGKGETKESAGSIKKETKK